MVFKKEKEAKKKTTESTGLVDAIVVLAKCPKCGRMYGMRTQKMNDGDWWRTWAFPIDEKRAKNEGYTSSVQGSLRATDEYPGCPYCGGMAFVQCARCGKLTCYNGESHLNCQWCGNYMDSFQSCNNFNVSGGDI